MHSTSDTEHKYNSTLNVVSQVGRIVFTHTPWELKEVFFNKSLVLEENIDVAEARSNFM